jgi:hypothetical protein
MSYVDKLLERNEELIKKTDFLLTDTCKIEEVSIPRARTLSDSSIPNTSEIQLPIEINLIYQTYFVNLKPKLSIEEIKIFNLKWIEFKNNYPDHTYRQRLRFFASIMSEFTN